MRRIWIVLLIAALSLGGCTARLMYEKVDAKAYAANPRDWNRKALQFTGTLVVVRERGGKGDLVLDAGSGTLILAEYKPAKVSQPYKVGERVTVFGVGKGHGVELTLMKGVKRFPEIALHKIESAGATSTTSSVTTTPISTDASTSSLADGSSASKPKPRVSKAAVLEELQADYGSDVTSVKVDDNGSGVLRIDVFTTYYPDRDVVDNVSGIARNTAVLGPVAGAYPEHASVDAYVWPSSRAFTLAHASVSWTDGKIDAPVTLWLNDVLK